MKCVWCIVTIFAIIVCVCACGQQPTSSQPTSSLNSTSTSLPVNTSTNETKETMNMMETTSSITSDVFGTQTSSQTKNTIISLTTTKAVVRNTTKTSSKLVATPPKENFVTDLGITQAMINESVYSKGNQARLAAVMKKARSGQPITIGFLGGSITDGSNVPIEKSYARLVKAWWEATFPLSRITYVNAGIGSTGSIIGVHRVDADLLSKKPDFVVLEYAVNDGTDTETRNAYESLVRRILKSPNNPALMLLFMCTNGGGSAQDSHAIVGKHYDLPMISYKDGISTAVRENRFPWTKFSDDTVHPNIFGYAVCGAFIKSYLNSVVTQLDTISLAEKPLPKALSGDFYQNTHILGSNNYTPKALGDFQKTNNALYFWKNGWEVKRGANRPIVFEVQARRVWLLYKRDITNTKGIASVSVDGAHFCDLNGHFQDGWGEIGGLQLVAKADTPQKYTISIQMKAGQNKDFVLAAVYVAE